MKQHITVKQLEELSDKDVCKLNTLLRHEWDLTKQEFEKYNWEKVLEETAKYCNIGKMIDILDEKCYDYTIYKYWNSKDVPVVESYDTLMIQKSKNYYKIGFDDKELCDALWEAVKMFVHDEL